MPGRNPRTRTRGSPPEPEALGPLLQKADARHVERAQALGRNAREIIPAKERRHRGPRGERSKLGEWRPERMAPGMPRWQARLVCAGEMCGAPTHRIVHPETGEQRRQNGGPAPDGWVRLYCRMRPVPGQDGRPLPHRCRQHGGNILTGAESPNAGNQSGRKHGLYSRAFAGEAAELFAELESSEDELHALRLEIAATKVRGHMALVCQREQEELIAEGVGPDDDRARKYAYRSRKSKIGEGPEGGTVSDEREYRWTDFLTLWRKFMLTLTDLLRAEAQIAGDSTTPEDFGEKARAMLKEMDRVHTSADGFEEPTP